MFQLLRNLEIRVRTKLKSTKNKASGFGSGIEKISFMGKSIATTNFELTQLKFKLNWPT